MDTHPGSDLFLKEIQVRWLRIVMEKLQRMLVLEWLTVVNYF